MAGRADNWSLVLNHEIEDPNKIVMSSSLAVVVIDTYPKALHHYLVLPKILNIKNVFELSSDHLPLLDDMFQLAKKLIDSLKMQPTEFLIGFKLDPSMQLLNMHVISTDFMSKHLKKERHWTNFHTNIFLTYDAACDQLKNKGNIEHLTEDELKKARCAPLQCNRCDFSFTYMGGLKKHLSTHCKGTHRPHVSVSWRSSRVEAVSRDQRRPVGQRTEVTAAQQIASLELPQSTSNIKPQPSLKDRVEALNKVLETFSIPTKETTPTTSDTGTTTTTTAGLNEGLGCDQETLEHKENACGEQQQEQQPNATLETSQNSSNNNAQPSLKKRLEALNKMLETISIKTKETTD